MCFARIIRAALISLMIMTLTMQQALAATYEDGLSANLNGDYKSAKEILLPLAIKGDARAQAQIGVMYYLGQGVIQDYVKAHDWLLKAAPKINLSSVFGNLGYMYQHGEGVEKNLTEAAKWFMQAAELGSADAQLDIGLMYHTGQGVAKDYKIAFKWYTLAAEQGEVNSQFNLGNMYASGRGILQDYTQAHMWFNIASSLGDEGARNNRDLVAKQMTPTQLETAQRLAHECVAKKYKGC